MFPTTARNNFAFGVELLTPMEALIKASCEGTCTRYMEGVDKKWLIVKSAHSNPCFCSKQLKDFGGKNKQQKVKMCVTNYFVISWTESIK